MASLINADNGVVSGSAGVKTTADSSGVLALQTNGTTALSISAAQVVSFTNSPTYTAGTANGVAYLNASKVLTTGSALTFDGTTLATTNLKLLSSGSILDGGGNTVLTPTSAGSVALVSNGAYTNGNITYNALAATGLHVWYSNSVELMRLTSTGLGIGTSSPGYKLEVNGGSFLNGNILTQAGSTFYNATGDLFIRAGTSGSLKLGAGGTNSFAILDSSGNLGLGTTSPSEKLHVYGANPYFLLQGSEASAQTLYIRESAGGLYFGQYGVATRMLLDSSGNLGIGTTTIGSRLTIGDPGTGASFTNAASGNLNIGLLAGTGSAQAYIYQRANAALLFGTNNAEVMRLDSSGNLLVGTTSGVGKVRIQGGAGTTPALYAYNTNATSGDYAAIFALGANNNNTSSFFLNCTEPGVANRFAIYGNGTYATLSDQRLKKNVETARNGYLDDVVKLRVVKYNWNSQADGEAKELGVIAQELEQVFPGLIQESKAEDADTSYKQIKTSVLPFILLKAMQEQQALIESLTARLNSLENK